MMKESCPLYPPPIYTITFGEGTDAFSVVHLACPPLLSSIHTLINQVFSTLSSVPLMAKQSSTTDPFAPPQPYISNPVALRARPPPRSRSSPRLPHRSTTRSRSSSTSLPPSISLREPSRTPAPSDLDSQRPAASTTPVFSRIIAGHARRSSSPLPSAFQRWYEAPWSLISPRAC